MHASQVEEIESKLDLLIDMFKIESCRTKSLLTNEHISHLTDSSSFQQQPEADTNIANEASKLEEQLKTRSNAILTDNKFQSEPSVTSDCFPQTRLVHRNLSDLGPRRMRKVKPYSRRSLNNQLNFPHLNYGVKEEPETPESKNDLQPPDIKVIVPPLTVVEVDRASSSSPVNEPGELKNYGHPQLKRLSANNSSEHQSPRKIF